jgi:transcription termination factor Rho
MSDKIELNDKLVSELREIARNLGIAEADELRKAQLVARIVEQQQLIEAARAQQNLVESNYTPTPIQVKNLLKQQKNHVKGPVL